MSYTKLNLKSNFTKRQENTLVTRKKLLGSTTPDGFFHEIEPGIVLDVILDHDHPEVIAKTIDPSEVPSNIDGTRPSIGSIDYSWIGRVKVRMVYSEQGFPVERLNWAIPLDQSIDSYPLINEIVLVMKHLDQYFYTKTLNFKNFASSNADFRIEARYGLTSIPFQYTNGPTDEMGVTSVIGENTPDKTGQLGGYFSFNPNIRLLKHFEGDKILESRFGSSIRFGGYGTSQIKRNGTEIATNPLVDQGIGDDYENGKGNPQILIRNRQRPINNTGTEKSFNGRIVEDINLDGTSIHITSGRTISPWVSNINKAIFQVSNTEEQPAYAPIGCTTYQFPTPTYNPTYNDSKYLIGNQCIINSDRIIIQSKKNETWLFAKSRLGLVSDAEVTIDCQKQLVLTSNTQTVINSPLIFLGEYGQTGEPALLGQTTINWLSALCDFLSTHTHLYHHVHKNAGAEDPSYTQFIKQTLELKALQQTLPLLCSKRVYVTGGGFAPGADGG